MKPYRVEYMQLAGWKADEVGLWLAENDEWLLLRHIPVDYVVDGYVLLSKEHIASRRPHKHRKQVERVLKLKGVKAEVPANFSFTGTVEMLRWVEEQYGLVEFTDQEESTFFGWIVKSDVVHVWPTLLRPNGTTQSADDTDPFVISEIQLIRFDTDYFNCMRLLWQHKQRLKLRKLSEN